MDETRIRLAQSTAAKEALLAVLEDEFSSEEIWLRGTTVGQGTDWALDRAFDGVVYGMAMNCPYSPRNYSKLQALRARGVEVVGVLLDGEGAGVEEYLRQHEIQFRVIRSAAGPLRRVLERGGTPFTLVVSKGRLGVGVVGDLPDKTVDRLLEAAANVAAMAESPSE